MPKVVNKLATRVCKTAIEKCNLWTQVKGDAMDGCGNARGKRIRENQHVEWAGITSLVPDNTTRGTREDRRGRLFPTSSSSAVRGITSLAAVAFIVLSCEALYVFSEIISIF